MKNAWIILLSAAAGITVVNWIASSNFRAAVERAGDNYNSGFRDGAAAAAEAYEHSLASCLRVDVMKRINERLDDAPLEYRTHALPPVMEEAPQWEVVEPPTPAAEETPRPELDETDNVPRTRSVPINSPYRFGPQRAGEAV